MALIDVAKLSFPSINPKHNEIDYLRNRFYESLSIRGFPAKIFLVESQTESFNGDSTGIVYKTPIPTFVHLEEFPKRTILSAMGWLNENTQQQPIAYLPTFYFDPVTGDKFNFYPKKNTKLEIEYDTLINEHATRTFQVSDIQADSPYVTNWIVLLTPLREKLTVPTFPVPNPPLDVDNPNAPSPIESIDHDFVFINKSGERRR